MQTKLPTVKTQLRLSLHSLTRPICPKDFDHFGNDFQSENNLFVCLFEATFNLSTICLFVCLRLYVPVNNFSVILGQLPGFNQY